MDQPGVVRQPRSFLWHNEKFRAVFAQVVTLALVFALGAYLINNAVENLAAQGKDFSFAFLGEKAGYDINQHFIPYTPESSNFQAMLVGILNTLWVAMWAIIAATLLGFVLGVLRLSNNWLVSRAVFGYVEFVRNVPVLVQIYLWYGLILHGFPRAKEAISFFDIAYLCNRGIYFPAPRFSPLIALTVIALMIGVVRVWQNRRRAQRVQIDTGVIESTLRHDLTWLLALPAAVFLLTGLPMSWELPELKGFNFRGGGAIKPEFFALWFSLTIYASAFIAEIVRAGIQAVPTGQWEAGRSLGLREGRLMRLIVLPQALRVIVPPLTSQYLNIVKNSSLAIAIGYMDIVATIGGITINTTGREMECMIIVLLLYLCFSLIISVLMNWYNRRVALVER